MNIVSIFDRGWANIVFEGRNQSYGAYRLRRENARDTLTAFIFAVLIMASAFGIFMLVNLLNSPKASLVVPDPVYPAIKLVKVYPVISIPSAPQPPGTKKSGVMVPSATPEPEEESQITEAPVSATQGTHSTLPNENTGNTFAQPGNANAVLPQPNSVEIPASLDRQPAFPGGLDEFYDFVGKNFRPVETDGKTVRVFLSFVIEKDGSLSDIKVVRDPGYGAGAEAIRVLKSLKVKWEPGMIRGQPVRTSYTMPITVKPGD